MTTPHPIRRACEIVGYRRSVASMASRIESMIAKDELGPDYFTALAALVCAVDEKEKG